MHRHPGWAQGSRPAQTHLLEAVLAVQHHLCGQAQQRCGTPQVLVVLCAVALRAALVWEGGLHQRR